MYRRVSTDSTFVFLHYESSYDSFHKHIGRIQRVILSYRTSSGLPLQMAILPIPLGPALQGHLPEVEDVVRMYQSRITVHAFRDPISADALFVDPSFLKVFSFGRQDSRAESRLEDPHSIVISTDFAHRIFGVANPISDILTLSFGGQKVDVKVAGVLPRVPNNSTIRFDLLLPFEMRFSEAGAERQRNDWGAMSSVVYVRIKKGVDQSAIGEKLASFVDAHFSLRRSQLQESGFLGQGDDTIQIHLQSLEDVHLGSGNILSFERVGSKSILDGVIVITVLVLIVSCTNFTNMVAGLLRTRNAELRTRRVLGATVGNTVAQIVSELASLVLVSICLGLATAVVTGPYFEQLSGAILTEYWTIEILGWLFYLIGLTAFLVAVPGTVIVAGLLPNYVLASRMGNFKPKLNGFLVFLQLLVAAYLVTCTLFLWDQADLLAGKALGFSDSEVIAVPLFGLDERRRTDFATRYEAELAGHTGILAMSGSSWSPGRGGKYGKTSFRTEEGLEIEAYHYSVGHNYLNAIGASLLEGRNFDEGLSLDSQQSLIVNQSFVSALGWANGAEKKLMADIQGLDKQQQIIGVVADYHFEPVNRKLEPLVLHMARWPVNFTVVRAHSSLVGKVLGLLKERWEHSVPDVPFSATRVDEDMDKHFHDEGKYAKVLILGAAVAVSVATLGLLGISTLIVGDRKKEMAIRRALGASCFGVGAALSRRSLIWALFAGLLSCPPAYVTIEHWLRNYAYRIDIGIVPFATGTLAALFAASFSLAYTSLRASSLAPTEELRGE